jgi:hypothetical protein
MLSLLLVAVCVGVAACGGSSTNSATSANAAATHTAAGGATSVGPTGASGPTGVGSTGPSGRYGARFSALRECLQKNGVTLPPRTPGQGPPRGGFLGGASGRQLPGGVSREKFQAALRKCGAPGRIARFGGAARFHNPAFAQALTKFAACMRENGINLPAPNTSGNGPIFNTTGIDTTSPQFASAEEKCRSDLTAALQPGGTGPSPTG